MYMSFLDNSIWHGHLQILFNKYSRPFVSIGFTCMDSISHHVQQYFHIHNMVFQPLIDWNTVFDLQLAALQSKGPAVAIREPGVIYRLSAAWGLALLMPTLFQGQLCFAFSKDFSMSVRYIVIALPRELLDAISLLLRVQYLSVNVRVTSTPVRRLGRCSAVLTAASDQDRFCFTPYFFFFFNVAYTSFLLIFFLTLLLFFFVFSGSLSVQWLFAFQV